MAEEQKVYDIPAMIKWQEKYIDALKELKGAIENKLQNLEKMPQTYYDEFIEMANLKIRVLQLESDIVAKEKIYKESFLPHTQQNLTNK